MFSTRPPLPLPEGGPGPGITSTETCGVTSPPKPGSRETSHLAPSHFRLPSTSLFPNCNTRIDALKLDYDLDRPWICIRICLFKWGHSPSWTTHGAT